MQIHSRNSKKNKWNNWFLTKQRACVCAVSVYVCLFFVVRVYYLIYLFWLCSIHFNQYYTSQKAATTSNEYKQIFFFKNESPDYCFSKLWNIPNEYLVQRCSQKAEINWTFCLFSTKSFNMNEVIVERFSNKYLTGGVSYAPQTNKLASFSYRCNVKIQIKFKSVQNKRRVVERSESKKTNNTKLLYFIAIHSCIAYGFKPLIKFNWSTCGSTSWKRAYTKYLIK